MKTKNEIKEMVKEIAPWITGMYLALTLAGFLGTYLGGKGGDRTFRKTIEERIERVERGLIKYDSSSWPIKILTFGEYLAFKLYQEELQKLPND